MPYHPAGAEVMLTALVQGDIYAHLHTADPPTTTNSITGSGYAPVMVTSGWTAEVSGNIHRRVNTSPIYFPTPGGDWDRPATVALWDRASLVANPSDPPELLRSAPISVMEIELNFAVLIPAGAIAIEIEVE